ncbi:MAG: hypothetical protein ACLFTK_07545, partial [Anaerolineales bacterium]
MIGFALLWHATIASAQEGEPSSDAPPAQESAPPPTQESAPPPAQESAPPPPTQESAPPPTQESAPPPPAQESAPPAAQPTTSNNTNNSPPATPSGATSSEAENAPADDAPLQTDDNIAGTDDGIIDDAAPAETADDAPVNDVTDDTPAQNEPANDSDETTLEDAAEDAALPADESVESDDSIATEDDASDANADDTAAETTADETASEEDADNAETEDAESETSTDDTTAPISAETASREQSAPQPVSSNTDDDVSESTLDDSTPTEADMPDDIIVESDDDLAETDGPILDANTSAPDATSADLSESTLDDSAPAEADLPADTIVESDDDLAGEGEGILADDAPTGDATAPQDESTSPSDPYMLNDASGTPTWDTFVEDAADCPTTPSDGQPFTCDVSTTPVQNAVNHYADSTVNVPDNTIYFVQATFTEAGNDIILNDANLNGVTLRGDSPEVDVDAGGSTGGGYTTLDTNIILDGLSNITFLNFRFSGGLEIRNGSEDILVQDAIIDSTVTVDDSGESGTPIRFEDTEFTSGATLTAQNGSVVEVTNPTGDPNATIDNSELTVTNPSGDLNVTAQNTATLTVDAGSGTVNQVDVNGSVNNDTINVNVQNGTVDTLNVNTGDAADIATVTLADTPTAGVVNTLNLDGGAGEADVTFNGSSLTDTITIDATNLANLDIITNGGDDVIAVTANDALTLALTGDSAANETITLDGDLDNLSLLRTDIRLVNLVGTITNWTVTGSDVPDFSDRDNIWLDIPASASGGSIIFDPGTAGEETLTFTSIQNLRINFRDGADILNSSSRVLTDGILDNLILDFGPGDDNGTLQISDDFLDSLVIIDPAGNNDFDITGTAANDTLRLGFNDGATSSGDIATLDIDLGDGDDTLILVDPPDDNDIYEMAIAGILALTNTLGVYTLRKSNIETLEIQANGGGTIFGTASDPFDLTSSGVQSVTFDGGASRFDDLYVAFEGTLEATLRNAALGSLIPTFEGSGATDQLTINVDNSIFDLALIDNDNNPGDTVIINGTPIQNDWGLTNNASAGSFDDITLNLDSGADTVSLDQGDNDLILTVNLGDGGDLFTVNQGDGALDLRLSDGGGADGVIVNGPSGADLNLTLTLPDSQTDTIETLNINADVNRTNALIMSATSQDDEINIAPDTLANPRDGTLSLRDSTSTEYTRVDF